MVNQRKPYLNENGEVVYCSDGISSDTVYAYIINTWIDENGETLYAKLVTAAIWEHLQTENIGG